MGEFRYIFQCLKCKNEFSYSEEEFKKMIVSPEINCPKCGSDMMMQVNCPEPVDFETKMKEIEKYFNEINFDDLEEENREE